MAEPPRRYRVAVDIGGTFTDLLILDEERQRCHVGKVLTTVPDPSAGVLQGIAALLETSGVAPAGIGGVIHGTTLVTNALIERRGARTALLTTAGFRDALEIGTEGRYDIYDLGLVKPAPLVERRLRFEVPERMNAAGTPLRTLDPEVLEPICDALQAEGIEAVAVCYLHAYANPAHEVATAELLRERLPSLPVTLSHRVAPALREYQRASTAVANAYVQPLAAGYLRGLEDGLRRAGVAAPVHIMLSTGGTATVETAADVPIRLVESGPAGGALAGAWWGRLTGHDEVLAFDMGGTTAKAVFTEHGEFAVTAESEVARVHRFKRGSGLPLLMPTMQMIEIGAGGGSIARLGDLGLPAVGPRSAGSEPGPACYGRGGREATVTDADLLLGYLDPHAFAGGTMTLDVDAARAAFGELASSLEMDAVRVAWGIHDLVNENMAAAARVHAAERGLDTRRYALVATGGAGPLHACGVARRLGLDTVVIPPLTGVGSAFGLLLAPLSFDITRSYVARLDRIECSTLAAILEELEREGRERVGAAGVADEAIAVRRSADLRYAGQGYEIRVEVPPGTPDAALLEDVRRSFERAYTAFYGQLCDGVPLEAVNWRVSVEGPRPDLGQIPEHMAARDDATGGAAQAAAEPPRRDALFDGTGAFLSTPVYQRHLLAPDFATEGPAIIEEAESTTVVPPGWSVAGGAGGCLLVRSTSAAGGAS
ncbi:MAG: hydantoinase/oxoprolinase family protein [Spirochaetaceae bacterium]|nr:hydantoinase/oxoprolinase family protein [Spirochaetaceae bacterium]